MRRSKHSGFRSRLLAIVFLFLNGVCIAAPGIKNISGDFDQAISSQSGQDFNTLESEENQLVVSSIINRNSRVSAASKTHICTTAFCDNQPVFSITDWSHTSIIKSGFLQKPGYYIFLFRYTLF